MSTFVVLDYGSGNIRSALRAVQFAAHAHPAVSENDVTLTGDPDVALAADGLYIPGVGAFRAVMDGLTAIGAHELVHERHRTGKPTLGVCVGLQVLFGAGSEHGEVTSGLGLWPGTVERLRCPVTPHMGWNTVSPAPASTMFAGIRGAHFYFVHSYAAHQPVPGALNTTCVFGEEFIAAVEDGPTWATQFHPEKSGVAGLRLLENWVAHVLTAKEKSHV